MEFEPLGLVALKFLHVGVAATWFGASWLAATDIRHSLEIGRPHADYLPVRIRRLEKQAIACGLTTLLSGLALVQVIYGLGRRRNASRWSLD